MLGAECNELRGGSCGLVLPESDRDKPAVPSQGRSTKKVGQERIRKCEDCARMLS